MKALMFELSGRTAFFRKPDVNSYINFTYNHIHKIALLGLLGTIIGLGGYNKQYKYRMGNRNDVYPEFYQQLKDLKVSIIPLCTNGVFQKSNHVFCNTTGFASKENGGTLVIREQWLEKPAWKIFILDDGSIDRIVFDILVKNIMCMQCKYIPYLGKKNHLAIIKECSIVELDEVHDAKFIYSMFPRFNYDIKHQDGKTHDGGIPYVFREYLPLRLRKEDNAYEYQEFIYTNVEVCYLQKLYSVYTYKNCSIAFY
ncbi:type I-B CRISPR-associated protein Cas5b [Petroclostridium sp. X23]|uniref:type I-B CRISPR-associated protein Cas5b n=1 Tax=Petroclostridium sp. X23 TaxID=3045146 RepID=UPI0024ACBF9C|nr:type I-B CRISPR-associated protein Cas5b [Petroclostridium sp. X23]WHH60985.1 type I-B CRISPR-associated protein Cas5b [Petroclostridium sp. X23]